jgi:hypothetical protein
MRRATAARLTLCSLAIFFATACSNPPARTIEFESAETTADGLRLMKTTKGHQIFLRPGIDMRNFSSVLVDPFMISYTNPREAPEGAVRTLDEKTEKRLTSLLRDVFIRKMDLSKEFDLVENPGPHAIRVQGWLYDIVVEEPPRDDPRNFPLCFAEMRVILTVRHSETAEALARVVDRVKLSCAAEKRARFHSATWMEMKAVLRPWATFLRDWLEELKEITPATLPRSLPQDS